MASNDPKRNLLDKLIAQALISKHWGCLGGYLSFVQKHDVPAFRETVASLLSSADSAWLGAALTIRSEYDEILFDGCLGAFGKKWIETSQFSNLRYGRMWEKIPSPMLERLNHLLDDEADAASVGLLVGSFMTSLSLLLHLLTVSLCFLRFAEPYQAKKDGIIRMDTIGRMFAKNSLNLITALHYRCLML